MKFCLLVLLATTCLGGCSFFEAGKEPAPPGAKEVVSDFYEYLRAGDTRSIDSLFYRIPVMESDEAAWFRLIDIVIRKVKDEQLDWEAVCAKELPEIAVVIVNQTMKQGKEHADPDAVYLVKKEGRWLLLPDIFANSAKDEVNSSLTAEQRGGRYSLQRWVLGELRGLTAECGH